MLTNTFFARAASLLLIPTVLLSVLMAAIVLGPSSRQRTEFLILPGPKQAAAIVETLEATPIERREVLLTALNSPAVSVTMVDGFPELKSSSAGSRVVGIVLDGYDRAFTNNDTHIEIRRSRLFERLLSRQLREQQWRPYRLYVRLNDGTFVLIEPSRSVIVENFLTRGILFLAIGGTIVLIGFLLAARQTARPVANLAANARAFADKLDAPDIEEGGPRELRDLAKAFNEMKARIRTLVSERTRFLAAIAHDLRTYLTRLRLRVDFIEDAEQRARAERDLEEMSSLIEDTLAFARAEDSNTDGDMVTDISAEVATIVAARQEVREPVTIGADIAKDLWAFVSPTALRRIIANLIDNAVRYGGAARIYAEAGADTITLRIEDDGPGVPEEALERLTAPFERVETSRGRETGGAGLGLAIVRGIVEAHGGTLTLANRESGGLSAIVTLRAAQIDQ